MLNVCVNGFGTVGKRIAYYLSMHPDVHLVGVSKFTPDADARLANMQNFPLFVKKEKIDEFENREIEIAGSLREMFEGSDLIIDASDKKGEENRKNFYDPLNKISILQGGEKHETAGFSFSSRANFEMAEGKRCARVVSCGTTALIRTLVPIAENYEFKNVVVQIIRRAADPADDKSGPINSVSWKVKSHHGEDVKSVYPLPITTNAFKIPHTLMHVHVITIEFNGRIPEREDLAEIFSREGRTALIEEAKSTSEMIERMRDLGFERSDSFLSHLHLNTVSRVNGGISFVVTVPQESIIIPENLDCILALNGYEREYVMKKTNRLMALIQRKKMLEEVFSAKGTQKEEIHEDQILERFTKTYVPAVT